MGNFLSYLWALAAIVVGFFVIKKVVSCLVRCIVLLLLVAVLAYIYYMYA